MSERDETQPEDGADDERLTTADLAGGRDDAKREDGRSMEAADDDVDESDAAAATEADTGGAEPAEARQPLFAADQADGFRERWADVQAGFVDEPRRAVEDADALVAEVMQRLAETFSTERATLEQQWDGDGEPSTEDLRVGLQRYRSFFDRLLSA
ncbi:MAG: hypothetical protein H0V94_00715 [Actinobacteria bacterium]|nr:hypothetical protein [Actinomycetota bacterium]